MKKIIIKHEYREFQCEVDFEDARFGRASVLIKEIIYPNRKIFRTEFFGERYGFRINDYPTIKDAVEKMVEKYLEEKKTDNEIIQKIRQFEQECG